MPTTDPQRRKEQAQAYRIRNREKLRERYWLNREKRLEEQRLSRERLRTDTFNAYATDGKHVCACCGEHRREFLGIDHINGGGKKEREKVGFGDKFYRYLRTNGYPPGYQILCHNCNFSRGRWGYCPHERERDAVGGTQ